MVALISTNRNKSCGGIYSYNYPYVWDVVTAAKEIAIGFYVLLEGSDGYAKEGYNFIWSTNSSGVINAISDWITDTPAISKGYESIFNVDFNKNGIID